MGDDFLGTIVEAAVELVGGGLNPVRLLIGRAIMEI
jgi:hypothetical protein